MTAYCQAGITRSGVYTHIGIVAADPRWLPVGSIVRIVDRTRLLSGSYTVMDTGSAIKGHHLDVFVPSCARARRIGRRLVRVVIVRRGWHARTGVTAQQ
ncbi:MAG TPA: 3D domain-containing protein [Vicinamibacterales bacterium]|nr:3D domain-containing protein [Vicinamibacterales bacterium]